MSINMNNLVEKEKHLFKKMPYLSTSLFLFDEFLVFGYSEIEQKGIINEITETINIEANFSSFPFISNTLDIKGIKNELHPSLLSSISIQNKQSMLDCNTIKYCLFPNPLPVLYSSNKQYYSDKQLPEYNSLFFTNVDTKEIKTKTLFYGYAYIFYEEEEEFQCNCTYYFPKAICFISQYPFFSHYYDLAKTIRQLFNNLQVPIEFVLYNIINHSISPLNNSINIEWVPDMFNKGITNTKSQFDYLSGYPIIDFDLSEIFSILPIEMLIKIILFSLIEFSMLIFSENFEILNCILYVISVLQYPVNDTMYLCHLVSVSEKNLNINISSDNSQSKFVEKTWSSLLGVNCTFNPDLDLSRLEEDELFIIDIDNRKEYLRNGKEEESKNGALYSYFNNVLSQTLNPTNSFEGNIITLYKKIKEILGESSSNLNNEENNNKGVKFAFIKSMNKEIIMKNKAIQEIFYSFLLNILKPFYPFSVVIKDIKQINKIDQNLKNHLKNTNKINRDNKEEYNYYELLCDTSKLSLYCINFLHKQESLDCYLIPLCFSEEFLHFNNSILDEYTIPHFEIIDLFFKPKDNEIIQIKLCNYNNALQKISNSNKAIKYYSNHLNQRSSSKNQLKQSLIFLYTNYLASLEENSLNELYPAHNIQYTTFHYSDLVDHIEDYMVQNKSLGNNYILSYATSVLSIITFEVMDEENINQLFQLVVELFIDNVKIEKGKCVNFQFLRKNITMYIKILYYYILNLSKVKVRKQFLLLKYHELLELLVQFEIQLNIDVMNNLIDINKYDNSRSEISNCSLNKHFIEKIQKKISPKQRVLSISLKTIQILETQKEMTHIIRLINNKCRDGVIKVETVFQTIEETFTDLKIKVKCIRCKNPFQLKLLFKTRRFRLKEEKEKLEVDIFSPLKIYNVCRKLIKIWFEKQMSFNALDKKIIKSLVVNLLFYQSRLNLQYSIPIVEELFV